MIIDYFRKIYLRNKQKKINKKYARDGLTDEVLTEQVKLNVKRHKYNISDETKAVYKNFVQ